MPVYINECKKTLGTCHHVTRDDHGLWTIPSGIHYISGMRVCADSSLDSVDTNRPKDDLAKDLDEIVDNWIDGGMPLDSRDLMQKLIMYIVARDHKILQHGIKVGKDQHEKSIS